MAGKWVTVEQYLASAEHAARKRDRRIVQEHDIDRVAAKLPCSGARDRQTHTVGIRAWREVDRDVHVALRREPARGRAAEQIREHDVRRRGADGIAETGDAALEISGERELQWHQPSIEPLR